MAKETVTQQILTDDLDGSTADRTVSFAWEGTSYEIELSKSNIRALEKALKPYVEKARRVRGATSVARSRRSSRTTSASGSREQLAAMRDGARSNGYDVSDRGGSRS